MTVGDAYFVSLSTDEQSRYVVNATRAKDTWQQGEAMHAIAAEMEESSHLTGTPVGVATLNNAEMGVLAEGILKMMRVALSAILALLVVFYRTNTGAR